MANYIVESPRGYDVIRIEDDLLTNHREVFLTDEVNTVTCAELIKQFMYLDRTDPGKEIVFYLNSPGGDVFSGLALYDVIMSLKSPIRTVCLGSCASMGSILFLTGNKREIREHGRLMIHDSSFSCADFSGYKPSEITEKAEELLKTSMLLRKIVSERTGQSMNTVVKKMKKDSYFDAKSAVTFGLATNLV